MTGQLERTSWRAVQIDHPLEWEVAVASGPDDPPRLVLTDRRYHRLDVKWRALKYVPNLDLWLTKYGRRDKKDKTKYSPLATAPSGWKGVVQKRTEGTLVHAIRFFRQARLIVEVTLVWPERRDPGLENRILQSVETTDGQGEGPKLFQAMGMSVICPVEFDLRETNLKVGQIQWDFRAVSARRKVVKKGSALRVERIALPDYWLEGKALREWVIEQLPGGHRQLRERLVPVNHHGADELVSVGKTPLSGRFRGRREMRLDLVWRCPIEERIYHIELTEQRRDEEISLPERFEVHCCRPVPLVKARNVG
jgi:hypothetical protein